MESLDLEIARIEAEAAPAVRSIRAWLRRRIQRLLDEPAVVRGPKRQPAPVVVRSRPVPVRKRPVGTSPEKRLEGRAIVARIAAGETAETIAAELGCRRRSIYNIIARAGLSTPRSCADCKTEIGRGQRRCKACKTEYDRQRFHGYYVAKKAKA